jgi:hypothetical protein
VTNPGGASSSAAPAATAASRAVEPRIVEPARTNPHPPESRAAAPEPPAPAPGAVTAASPLVLELTAVTDCPIVVIRDGGPAESQTLPAGGRLRLEAREDVALTVSDGAAVTWRINGRPAKPLGRSGAEVSVTITPANAAEFIR